MSKKEKKELGIAIAGGVVAVLITAFLSFYPEKSGWTVFFAQIVNAAAIVVASYFTARIQALQHSAELVQQRADMSIRRVLNLIENVKQFNIALEAEKKRVERLSLTDEQIDTVQHSYETLQRIIQMNLTTTDDIIKDWGDLIPEKIEELKERAKGDKR